MHVDLPQRDHRVVIVGGGLSGIAVAVKLKQAGIHDFVILERADRPGGTWRENTYPGCGCDVPSVLYSYSFAPRFAWSRAFAPQPEILSYIEETVSSMGLRSKMHFGTELTEASWNDGDRRWELQTSAGRYRAQFMVMAAGPLTEPSIPQVPGLRDFEGAIFHSARWDHDFDLRGKRVAIIGTGASAIQFTPEVQKLAAQVHVFQRTAPWVLPRPNPRTTPTLRSLRRHVSGVEALERAGVQGLIRLINFGLIHPSAMRAVEPAARRVLRRSVPDADLHRKVSPKFTIGCKRILFSNQWYETLAQDNVELLDSGLARIEPGKKVVSARGDVREVDAIIFGTGFDVRHPPIAKRVRCTTGEMLAERWNREGAQAYLGTTIADLPNAFLMIGPNIVAYTSFISVAEWQSAYIVDAIRQAEQRGLEVIRLPRTRQDSYNETVQTQLQGTVWNAGGCVSYYLDEHGRNIAAWPGTLPELKKRLSRFDLMNYQVRVRSRRWTRLSDSETSVEGEHERLDVA